jgi:hypothetical protein
MRWTPPSSPGDAAFDNTFSRYAVPPDAAQYMRSSARR